MFDFIYNIDIWAAICFILGFTFVIIEMFFPGFGFPGIAGLILLFAGVVLTAKTLTDVLVLLAIILVVLGIALAIILRSASKGRLSKLVLTDSLEKQSGFEGTEDFSPFLDKEGVALTPLRPSGTAEFDGVKLDVVSEFDMIEKDSKVKIIKVEGRRIVVRKID
ncbi:MAG TPA: NfeD family protein [Acetivibrio sp.]|uniref:NfeD family protein n=1 Tax=Acetivibrio sp. TaxID=1872092 RepID=UPI002C914DBE|nr:NfeD family protein [Acetivibrio sp.]HOM02712.1 NfeD family protein [Acetivibrio sp.]